MLRQSQHAACVSQYVVPSDIFKTRHGIDAVPERPVIPDLTVKITGGALSRVSKIGTQVCGCVGRWSRSAERDAQTAQHPSQAVGHAKERSSSSHSTTLAAVIRNIMQ